MGRLIASFLLTIVVLAGLCGFGYFRYNNPVELKGDVDVTDINYDSATDTSTFTCKVDVKNPNYDFGLQTTEFSYIVTFRGKNGLTLHEIVVKPDATIGKEAYSVELSFGADGDYDAVKGEVKKAEIHITSASYENASRYRMANGGEKYETKLVWHIVWVVSMVLLCLAFFLTLFTLFEGGILRTIFDILICIGYIALGYNAFINGAMPIIVALLA